MSIILVILDSDPRFPTNVRTCAFLIDRAIVKNPKILVLDEGEARFLLFCLAFLFQLLTRSKCTSNVPF